MIAAAALLLLLGSTAAHAIEDPTASLQTRCEAGEWESCNQLGLVYTDGRGVPPDQARAVALFEQACEGGMAVACSNAGLHHRDGEGVPANLRKARALFVRACGGGSTPGCVHLEGLDFTDGRSRKERRRGEESLRKMCREGNTVACSYLASGRDRGLADSAFARVQSFAVPVPVVGVRRDIGLGVVASWALPRRESSRASRSFRYEGLAYGYQLPNGGARASGWALRYTDLGRAAGLPKQAGILVVSEQEREHRPLGSDPGVGTGVLGAYQFAAIGLTLEAWPRLGGHTWLGLGGYAVPSTVAPVDGEVVTEPPLAEGTGTLARAVVAVEHRTWTQRSPPMRGGRLRIAAFASPAWAGTGTTHGGLHVEDDRALPLRRDARLALTSEALVHHRLGVPPGFLDAWYRPELSQRLISWSPLLASSQSELRGDGLARWRPGMAWNFAEYHGLPAAMGLFAGAWVEVGAPWLQAAREGVPAGLLPVRSAGGVFLAVTVVHSVLVRADLAMAPTSAGLAAPVVVVGVSQPLPAID